MFLASSRFPGCREGSRVSSPAALRQEGSVITGALGQVLGLVMGGSGQLVLEVLVCQAWDCVHALLTTLSERKPRWCPLSLECPDVSVEWW